MTQSRDRRWRLLPSEHVLWQGRPRAGVPRDPVWAIATGLTLTLAVVSALFAGLLVDAQLPGGRTLAFVAAYLCLMALGIHSMPRQLRDPCEFMITDRQVIWRRGLLRRTLERSAITYARIHWHRSVPGVGHLELVRAVPFGPLSRRQRILFHDVQAPDRLLSIIRGVPSGEHAGYSDVRLTDRLDPEERVVWGDGPAGLRLGYAEMVTAVLGALTIVAGVVYAYRTGLVLVTLEQLGLSVHTMKWLLLFLVILVSATVMLGTGGWLVWKGMWGARQQGSHTEYVLTNSRLLIRRGLTELSIDRRRIVDVADVPTHSGCHNLVLILDGPNGRALDDSGAMMSFSGPPRAAVPPVLYEISEPDRVRDLLLTPAAA